MAGQIARQIGARQALARVYDPVRSEIYGEMGLITFSPTVLSAERLFRMVTRDGEGG
jgi:Trk K+ transport system NAD-binding subunit